MKKRSHMGDDEISVEPISDNFELKSNFDETHNNADLMRLAATLSAVKNMNASGHH